MSASSLVPSLSLFTLVAVLLVAIGALVFFLRKRSNRHPMDTPRGHEIERERTAEVENARRSTAEGAHDSGDKSAEAEDARDMTRQ